MVKGRKHFILLESSLLVQEVARMEVLWLFRDVRERRNSNSGHATWLKSVSEAVQLVI